MTVSPRSALTNLPGYVFAELEKFKADARGRGISFIDLGIGSPDSPVAAPIIDALAQAARDPSTHGYPPFRGTIQFLEAAARFMQQRFGVKVDPALNVLALSGSKEGLSQVAMSYCGPGDVALVPDLYYPVHARAALLNGSDVYYLRTSADSGFLPDLESIPADVLQRAKLLMTNYPNNPTGAVATHEFFQQAVAFAKRQNIVLVSDLAYSELSYDGFIPPSVFEVDGAMDVAVEFHSCSKSFNMAGLRLGFAVGQPDIIDTIAAYRSNVAYGTPPAIQAAGAYALDHFREFAGPVCEMYARRRNAAVQAFRDIGWDIPVPKATMYLWIPIPQGYTEWEWTRLLLNRCALVVTPGIAFGPGGAGYFRISLVADEATLVAAIHRIKDVI